MVSPSHMTDKKQKKNDHGCEYGRLFVVDADTENLLSRSEASDLNLVERVQTINDICSTPSEVGGLDDKPSQCKPAKISRKKAQIHTAYIQLEVCLYH